MKNLLIARVLAYPNMFGTNKRLVVVVVIVVVVGAAYSRSLDNSKPARFIIATHLASFLSYVLLSNITIHASTESLYALIKRQQSPTGTTYQLHSNYCLVTGNTTTSSAHEYGV